VNNDIRDAAGNDAEAIAHIYNRGRGDRAATLETTLRSADERWQWLADRTSRYAGLVACNPDSSEERLLD
jgi:L-amino acid N-acyltransferase YncA